MLHSINSNEAIPSRRFDFSHVRYFHVEFLEVMRLYFFGMVNMMGKVEATNIIDFHVFLGSIPHFQETDMLSPMMID